MKIIWYTGHTTTQVTQNRKQGQRNTWEEKEVKTINFNVTVVKITLVYKEYMQMFETLRVDVLPGFSCTMLCTDTQNNTYLQPLWSAHRQTNDWGNCISLFCHSSKLNHMDFVAHFLTIYIVSLPPYNVLPLQCSTNNQYCAKCCMPFDIVICSKYS
jgi:hypothetical protein